MQITRFDDLLRAARAQAEPQQLLLVFASAELPEDATAAQRADHAAGHGGTPVPLMCVDKSASELRDFAALKAESEQVGCRWQLMFASTLSGRQGQPVTTAAADAALQRMVDMIKQGHLDPMIAFDAQGQALALR